MFALRSPKNNEVVREVDARQLWQRILETRLQTGEPYLLFIDAVNRALPKHQRELGLKVSTSNLCSEITLPTGIDHRGEERTAVCCLSSLNIETWDEWRDEPGFIEDVLRFLDNVLTQFIEDRARRHEARANIPPLRERSVGLGVMGFHSFLQAQEHPVRKRDGEVLEHEDVPQDPPRRRRGLGRAGAKSAAPARMPQERGMMARF